MQLDEAVEKAYKSGYEKGYGIGRINYSEEEFLDPINMISQERDDYCDKYINGNLEPAQS